MDQTGLHVKHENNLFIKGLAMSTWIWPELV